MSHIQIGSYVEYKSKVQLVVSIKDNKAQILDPSVGNTKLNVLISNLIYKGNLAPVVTYEGKGYIVTLRNKIIISLATGRVMKWSHSHPMRLAILAKV